MCLSNETAVTFALVTLPPVISDLAFMLAHFERRFVYFNSYSDIRYNFQLLCDTERQSCRGLNYVFSECIILILHILLNIYAEYQ